MNDKLSHLRQWWLSLVTGIIFILLAVWTFIVQPTIYADIAILIAISFIIIGGFRAFYGIYNRKKLTYSGLLLMNGIIEFCVFLVLIFAHSSIEDILPVYVGFILLFRTILGVGIAINFYYSHLSGWFIPLVFAILGIFAAFLMIWKPLYSGISYLIYPALTFLFVGIAQLGIAIGLKKLNAKHKN